MSGGSRRDRHSSSPWSARASADAIETVITALARALDAPTGEGVPLAVERQRIAGRSNIFVVGAPTAIGGLSQWVVKQPHTLWVQDDLDSPVSAEQEFQALTRLHAHFQGFRGPSRVPAPVAYLPEIGALAMEYVPGRTTRELLNYGSALRPAALLNGLATGAEFLRHVHALESFPPRTIDLREEAQKVRGVAAEKLEPAGLSLPDEVARTLEEFPRVEVASPQVWLHGDFGPGNILLADDGSTVGLDPALRAVGPPEDDLVRFVVQMSGSIRFAPEIVARPASRLRRGLENQLLRGYYGSSTYPALFELRLLHQLARRWGRARELAQQNKRRSLLPIRLRLVDAQMRLLMKQSARRLIKGSTS